jgi:nucleotide-binding universal stress UspA family protein
MQIRTILFPTDFSDSSDRALVLASSLARDNEARLLIVHVNEPHIGYAEGLAAAYTNLTEELRSNAEQLLERVKPPFADIDYERRLIEGTPAAAIVKLAETEEDIDFIVLGTHGRTGVSRLLMGSVAEAVVRKAPCPVLTIKQPSEKTAMAQT